MTNKAGAFRTAGNMYVPMVTTDTRVRGGRHIVWQSQYEYDSRYAAVKAAQEHLWGGGDRPRRGGR